jgi:uncharacterized protein (DUF2249 family)
VITPSDRVAAVLRTDERLVEVFASAAPALERLRNPAMRRTMARLVTVAQAAKIAGLDPQELVARLNAAAGSGDEAVPSADTNEPVEEQKMSAVESDIPAALSGLPAERLVDLDVREDLRRGEEPFSRIMAAKAALKPGEVLRLRATFDPVPLYHVMGKQGYEHWTEQLGEDDWRVWFHRPDAVAAPAEAPPHTESAPTAASGSLADAPEEEIVILDVRGMDPPEPMMLTIAALETLPAGKTLLQINVRVPQFLLPRLEEMGFKYEVREQKDGPVRVFIRR